MRSLEKIQTYMQVCRDISRLSHDSKIQVATIIITDNFKEICSIGYNGDYSGGPNSRTDMTHGQSNFLHSEENALFHLGKPLELRSHLILMCTHKPCSMCAKRIVNSGIKRVIYDTEYSDSLNQTDQIFEASGVKCFSLDSLFCSKEKLDAYLNACHM
jgi:dCMP deaminase